MRVPKGCALLLLAFVLLSGCMKLKTAPESQNAALNKDAEIATDKILDLCMFQLDTLNPLATSARHNAEVLSLLYDSLFVLTSENEAVPNLCTKLTLSADECRVTLDIRKNVFFQNGERLAAKDVVASVNFIKTTEGFYQTRLSCVREAKVKNGKVELLLNQKTENISRLLDFPVLPATFLSGAEVDSVLLSPVSGSGIFCLSEYSTNKLLTLSVNPKHHSGSVPDYGTVRIHLLPDRETALFMLENKEIDVLAQSALGAYTYTPPMHLHKTQYPTDRLLFLGVHERYSGLLPENVIRSLQLWAEQEKVGVTPNRNLVSINKGNTQALEGHIKLLYSRESLAQTRVAQKLAKTVRADSFYVMPEDETENKYLSRIEKGQYDLFLGETESLPNLDSRDLSKFQDKNSPDGIVGLFFIYEFLYFNQGVHVNNVQTKNPYFCFTGAC